MDRDRRDRWGSNTSGFLSSSGTSRLPFSCGGVGCAGAPLLLGSYAGHLKMVELLLDRGAPFDARNPQGGTALRSAADTGHIDVVRVLLARSAQPNVVDTFGKTPRHYATEHGHREIVEILDKLR